MVTFLIAGSKRDARLLSDDSRVHQAEALETPCLRNAAMPRLSDATKLKRNTTLSADAEGRHNTILIAMMILILVAPALLMIVYLIFYPESFQTDITPRKDSVLWSPRTSQ